MRLLVTPGACSFASHVVVRELDLPIEIVCVSLTDPQAPHRRLNPLGRVPTLALNDGTVVTETTAILPLLADLRPGTPLFAPAGSLECAQIQSWLGYLNAEVHAGCFRAINRPQRFCSNETVWPQIREQGKRRLLSALERQLQQTLMLAGG
ncbi:glutathione S-transferase N-terminal domain-containing protein [Polaromonas sp. P1-6]|nr:glutathione S-transferase N-terminal domain-containing protein [Polaromonas sp. P1-6]